MVSSCAARPVLPERIGAIVRSSVACDGTIIVAYRPAGGAHLSLPSAWRIRMRRQHTRFAHRQAQRRARAPLPTE